MPSMIQWCDVPRPSVKRPSHTAWFDSAARAMAIGWRVWIGSTAVPSSIRPVACPMSVIAVSASKSPGTWGTQIEVNPAASAASASATSCATLWRYRPLSGPIIRPIRIPISLPHGPLAFAPALPQVLALLFSFCENTNSIEGTWTSRASWPYREGHVSGWLRMASSMVKADEPQGGSGPGWRQRAVSKSLTAARTRAEHRVQGLLDAAFALIDERGTTQFTIQEVVDRSKQSLRGFYQYFDGKDELLFALLEETIRESLKDLRSAVDSESRPLERLRAFTICLHEWCEPLGTRRKRGAHNRLPISEFSLQLALKDPERLSAAMTPISRMLVDVLKAAVAAGSLKVTDPQRAALLIQQTVMYGWLMNRFVQNSRTRVTAEDAWEFCLHGLGG